MKVQYDNRLMSSFMLFLDNQIQTRGFAYQNYSGQLYPVNTPYQGLYAYAAPFRQLCNDTSISGANVMSGVYVNGTFVTVGQSGLSAINHTQGTVYFTAPFSANTVVSGRYAIKDINIELTDLPESKLLFETKYVVKSKFNQTVSGLDSDVRILPAVYLKMMDGDAAHAAFGGIKDNQIKLRAIIMAENEFQRIAVCNILKNLAFSGFSVAASTPFDYLGNFTGTNYNYNTLSVSTEGSPLITEVTVKNLSNLLADDYRNLGRTAAMADFTVSTFMR